MSADRPENTVSKHLLPVEERRKILSITRLKVALTGFVALLLAALGGLMVVLVTVIFNQLDPTIEQDLRWKCSRGAADMAHSGELGLLLRDKGMLEDAFGHYQDDPDVVSIVALDAEGNPVAHSGADDYANDDLFAGDPLVVHRLGDNFRSWAQASVEGAPAGRVAVVVSAARLKAGNNLRRRILLTLAGGLIGGLVLSFFFVTFYIGPVIRVSERAFLGLEEAALEMASKQRLERELEIGARIQTCILPEQPTLDGLQISAKMVPADEVGGDYYDVIPTPAGGFIGIGDVAGHGLTAGLVMLMVQSGIASLVSQSSNASPTDVLVQLNEVVYENVRHRLRNDEHVTLTLFRYERSGRMTFAGAHEELVLYRKRTGKCELVPTPGIWLGAIRSIRHATKDSELELEDGDVLVLYTDGVTEMMNEEREQFGLERMTEVIERHADQDVEQIRDRLLAAVWSFGNRRDDDVTLLVMRYAAETANEAREMGES